MKHLRNLCLFLMIQTPLCATGIQSDLACSVDEKIYIDTGELDMSHDRFKIHMGHNTWVEALGVFRDEKGLYTLDSQIIKVLKGDKATYRNEWKCPYCFHWWPMGKRCKNEKCPSKFTDMMKVRK